jgi:hypothetical protein
MKILINYKDWLLQIRGEIIPQIGDRVYNTKVNDYFNIADDDIERVKYTTFDLYWEYCYVEVDYNPNEVIEFAEWVNKYFIKKFDGWIFNYQSINDQAKTITELLNIFRNGNIQLTKIEPRIYS